MLSASTALPLGLPADIWATEGWPATWLMGRGPGQALFFGSDLKSLPKSFHVFVFLIASQVLIIFWRLDYEDYNETTPMSNRNIFALAFTYGSVMLRLKVLPRCIALLSHHLPTTSFLTSDSLSDTMSFSSAMSCRSSGRLSLFLNFSSVPSSLEDDRQKKKNSPQQCARKIHWADESEVQKWNDALFKLITCAGEMRKSNKFTAGNKKMSKLSTSSFISFWSIKTGIVPRPSASLFFSH